MAALRKALFFAQGLHAIDRHGFESYHAALSVCRDRPDVFGPERWHTISDDDGEWSFKVGRGPGKSAPQPPPREPLGAHVVIDSTQDAVWKRFLHLVEAAHAEVRKGPEEDAEPLAILDGAVEAGADHYNREYVGNWLGSLRQD